MSTGSLRLAADIGGTFTDVVLDNGQRLYTGKVATDSEHPEMGVLRGIDVVLESSGSEAGSIDVFIHGTTLATNALIERKGSRTALITTEGFRDSLEIAYENRFDQYDLLIDKPVPLIPRNDRFTIKERMSASGEVLIDLDELSVLNLVPALRHESFDSIAVGLLHSYSNPSHETRVRELLELSGFQCEISLSCEVCPEIREYERLSTTACNAYVQPLMAGYLKALETGFRERGFNCPMYMMTSGGGMTTFSHAMTFPIRLVESGPSGGAVLAARRAAELKAEQVVSFDMGGTTAKIALLENYQPKTARNFEIARAARFQKGSGMPVRIPVVEMIEIGAGGGSIAHTDSIGRLCIGPQSAGAQPGPACFDKGGRLPTVTDANLLLGRINPETFAEGKLTLNSAAARTAVESTVGGDLGLEVEITAIGITEMVEENMASAARIHSVEHGVDLSRYTMIAFGGGGPLHASSVATKLGINRIVIPANASVGSALGFLSAPVAHELVHSLYTTLDDFRLSDVNEMLQKVTREARSVVESGAAGVEMQESRSAFMRYVGQGHEIQVPIPTHTLDASDIQTLRQTYDDCYRELYGRTIPERDIEVLSWSVIVATLPSQVICTDSPSDWVEAVVSRRQSIWLPAQNAFEPVNCYWRPHLRPGCHLEGPALVEEPQTTCYITKEFKAHVDAGSNLILERSL